MKDVEPQDATLPPYEIPYNILGLHKKLTIVKGEVQKVEYYGVHDIQTNYWDDLVVVEDRQYLRQGGFVYLRQMDVTWYYTDGTSGQTETYYKFYTLPQAINEGIRRRNNIVSQVKIDTIGIVTQTQGVNPLVAETIAKQILREIDYELSLYIDGDVTPIYNKFFDLELDVLDDEVPNSGGLTLRQYILYSIIT
jgi:hypothetical protein